MEAEKNVSAAMRASVMKQDLLRNHVCGEACTGQTRLGDGTVLQLKCPYKNLDPSDATDRRIIYSIYRLSFFNELMGMKVES